MSFLSLECAEVKGKEASGRKVAMTSKSAIFTAGLTGHALKVVERKGRASVIATENGAAIAEMLPTADQRKAQARAELLVECYMPTKRFYDPNQTPIIGAVSVETTWPFKT